MKYKYIILAVTAIFAFCKCSDADYNDKYPDPSKISKASIDKMMTGVLFTGADYVTPNYWRFFGFDNQNVGSISQTWGMSTSASLYEGGYPPYIDEGWWKFQNVLTQFKYLEKLFNDASESEQKVFKPYYLTAKIFMYQCLLQTLDCWGDIPFSEAGQLPVTGKVVYPKKDDAKTLYKLIIEDLGPVVEELKTAGKVSIGTDYLNDGNMDKWEKYANSIRLRAAIRVSSNGDLQELGKSTIKTIPESKSLVTGTDDMIKVVNRRSGNFNWNRMEGITDWRTCALASKAMVDMLNGDPRLPLIYDIVRDGSNKGKHVGVDTHDASDIVSALINGKDDANVCQYSYVNETSYRDNRNIDGYVVTPSEIAFYKAEAIVRGIISGDAKKEFVKALSESVKLYAAINKNSDAPLIVVERSPKVDMSAWTDAAIETWAGAKWPTTPDDQLKAIYEQTWLHFGIINSVQSWNTIRRTGYPALYYPTVSSNKCPNVPQRFIVPMAEWSVNPNIENEKTPDAYYQKLFWAKP